MKKKRIGLNRRDCKDQLCSMETKSRYSSYSYTWYHALNKQSRRSSLIVICSLHASLHYYMKSIDHIRVAIGIIKSITLERVWNTHSSSKTSLSGFDVTAVAVVGCEYDWQVYLNCSTIATKPFTMHSLPVVHLQCGFMAYHYTTVVLVQGVATSC